MHSFFVVFFALISQSAIASPLLPLPLTSLPTSTANVIKSPPPQLFRRTDIQVSNRIFFVQGHVKPIIQGGSLEEILLEQETIKASLTAKNIRFTERFSHTNILNAISLDLNEDLLPDVHGKNSRLSDIEGVMAVWPMVR